MIDLREWVDARIDSILARPGMWAGCSEALEAQVLTLLDVKALTPLENDPRADTVFSRYRVFKTEWTKGKPGPITVYAWIDRNGLEAFDNMTDHLRLFVASERSRA
jgi:hypothetical protein